MGSKLTLKRDLSSVVDIKMQELNAPIKSYSDNRVKKKWNTKKKDQKMAKMRTKKAVEYLVKAYPRTFFDDTGVCIPLKITIHEDLLAQFDNMKNKEAYELTKTLLRRALAFYTRSVHYYAAILNNENRYDLDGKIAGQVTTEEKNYSSEQLAEIINSKKKSTKEKN